MRILGNLVHGFMALALAAGWAGLYALSGSGETAAVERARAALGELRALDAGWNQRLVADRLRGDAQGVVPAGARPARFRTPYAKFEQAALALGDARVGGLLAGLRRAFEDKAAALESYGARREDAAFEAAWLASTGPRLDAVARALERRLDDAQTEAELYRLALLDYSAFLLAVLAFLVWSLERRRREIDRLAGELRAANASLEARVAERPRELSEARAKLKASEAMLIQSEKMSSLGQMVAGIAHEVNTPLAYVKSSLEAVRKSLPDSARLAAETARLLELLSAEGADETALAAQFAQVRGILEEARARAGGEVLDQLVKDGLFGIGQISEVVANLKDFSRVDRGKVAEVDLHESIDSAIRIGRAQLKDRNVRREFGRIPRLSCSPSQLNQVFLNLLVNAAQATKPGTGNIVVRTGMRGPDLVAVDVADDGQGIPADVLPKIFDPFFTTKPVGQGTGLGLAISYKIVENHGGRIEVQSRPGAGTRFTVLLPVRAPAAA